MELTMIENEAYSPKLSPAHSFSNLQSFNENKLYDSNVIKEDIQLPDTIVSCNFNLTFTSIIT